MFTHMGLRRGDVSNRRLQNKSQPISRKRPSVPIIYVGNLDSLDFDVRDAVRLFYPGSIR